VVSFCIFVYFLLIALSCRGLERPLWKKYLLLCPAGWELYSLTHY